MDQNQVLSRLSCKDINDYSFIKMLGTGSYIEVSQGKNNINGEETAIKVIDKVFQQKAKQSHLIYIESNALMSINHPGVIKCYTIIQIGFGQDWPITVSLGRQQYGRGQRKKLNFEELHYPPYFGFR